MSFYRNQLEAWLGTLEITATSVLDIGGGSNPVIGRVKHWEVEEYKILDNGTEFPKVKIDIEGDINNPGDILEPYIGNFDIVFCLEVAEYWYDPVGVMKNIYKLLKPSGEAYISFPTLYPLHNPPNIDYLRYSRNAIEKLLEVAGFGLWEITPRKATKGKESLASFYGLEGMHPIKRDESIYHIGYMVRANKTA